MCQRKCLRATISHWWTNVFPTFKTWKRDSNISILHNCCYIGIVPITHTTQKWRVVHNSLLRPESDKVAQPLWIMLLGRRQLRSLWVDVVIWSVWVHDWMADYFFFFFLINEFNTTLLLSTSDSWEKKKSPALEPSRKIYEGNPVAAPAQQNAALHKKNVKHWEADMGFSTVRADYSLAF